MSHTFETHMRQSRLNRRAPVEAAAGRLALAASELLGEAKRILVPGQSVPFAERALGLLMSIRN
ncbi:MAG TPA: hypothetical protein VGR65_14255 [Casimicrobiaceae bacterium]|jgi:hypothetical protein|nr:hypothetical protein [Casimicrobiaceae bacterium]